MIKLNSNNNTSENVNFNTILTLQKNLRSLNLWEIKYPNSDVKNQANTNNLLSFDKNISEDNKLKCLLELNTKSESNIITSSMSKCSKYIAYSNSMETIIYNFVYNEKSTDIGVEKILRLKYPCQYVYFIENDNKCVNILLVNNKKIMVIKIEGNKVIEKIELSNDHLCNISSCNFTQDKKLLIVGFIDGKIVSYDLNKLSNENKIIITQSNSNGEYVTSINFIAKNTDNLITNVIFVLNSNNIKNYDIEMKKFTGLCMNENTEILSQTNKKSKFITPEKTLGFENKFTDNLNNKNDFKNVPDNLLTWYNKILGIVQIKPNFLIAYTDYNFIPIYLDQEIPSTSVISRDLNYRNKSKSNLNVLREYHNELINLINKEDNIVNHNFENQIQKNEVDNSDNKNFSIVTKFLSNVFMQYFDNYLFVVEVNWEHILKKMTDPIVKKRFKK